MKPGYQKTMYVPYEQMPDSSRLWIYPASRNLTSEEVKSIGTQLQEFCNKWAAHGQELMCSWAIRHDRFILLLANEEHAGASGCSIDASTRLILDISSRTGVDLVDRRPAFQTEKGVDMIALSDLRRSFDSGVLTAESLVFNLRASTKGEWETSGIQPAAATWLKRYIRDAVTDIPE